VVAPANGENRRGSVPHPVRDVDLRDLKIVAHSQLFRVGIVSDLLTAACVVVLSILSSADYLQAFQPRELQTLAHVFVGAQTSGYMIVLLFYGLGSTTYMYLLVRSRYVPKGLALLALVGSALVVLFSLVRMVFPALPAAASAAVLALPAVAKVLLALIVVPIVVFEAALGLWLLVKGVRMIDLRTSGQ
jgi:hypothetical protein